jgi:polyisoprenoid-binding protein YceI
VFERLGCRCSEALQPGCRLLLITSDRFEVSVRLYMYHESLPGTIRAHAACEGNYHMISRSNRFRILTCALGLAVGLMANMAVHTQAVPRHGTQSTVAAIPFDGKWKVDTADTCITFSVKHVVGNVRGRFNSFYGDLVADGKDITRSSINFTIDAATIDTNNVNRDTHLRTPHFFDTEQYPKITFRSTSIARNGNKLIARGSLTMHGVTRQIELPFEMHGPVKDEFGDVRVGIRSTIRINRQDYGVSWNKVLDSGGIAISNDMDIEINLAVLKPGPNREQ